MRATPVMTHGISGGVTDPKDAVSKEIEIAKFDNDLYAICFSTVWEEGKEPVLTRFSLSSQSIELLQEVTWAFLHNLSHYKIDPASSPNQSITRE